MTPPLGRAHDAPPATLGTSLGGSVIEELVPTTARKPRHVEYHWQGEHGCLINDDHVEIAIHLSL